MRKQLANLFAFLTVLPFTMDMDCLTDSAKLMWVFPIVGASLGLIAGFFGWIFEWFLPSLVVGVLSLGVLLFLTGLHHTDGLLDFGDAIMCHGTAERKIEVMHDQLTGAGAIGLGVMTYLVTAFSFVSVATFSSAFTVGYLGIPIIVAGLVVVEMCAKLSMVVATFAGKEVHKGMNSPFMDVMHGKNGVLRLVAALFLSLGVALLVLSWAGFATVLATILTSLIMVAVANRHFGGVTGDVLGATNELMRMVSIVVLLAML